MIGGPYTEIRRCPGSGALRLLQRNSDLDCVNDSARDGRSQGQQIIERPLESICPDDAVFAGMTSSAVTTLLLPWIGRLPTR